MTGAYCQSHASFTNSSQGTPQLTSPFLPLNPLQALEYKRCSLSYNKLASIPVHLQIASVSFPSLTPPLIFGFWTHWSWTLANKLVLESLDFVFPQYVCGFSPKMDFKNPSHFGNIKSKLEGHAVQPLTSTTGYKACCGFLVAGLCPGSGRPCLGRVNQDDRAVCLWSSGLPLGCVCLAHKSFSTLRTLQSLLWCPCLFSLLSSVTQFSLLNNWTGRSLVSWKSSHGHRWCHLESEHLHVQFWRTGAIKWKAGKWLLLLTVKQFGVNL